MGGKTKEWTIFPTSFPTSKVTKMRLSLRGGRIQNSLVVINLPPSSFIEQAENKTLQDKGRGVIEENKEKKKRGVGTGWAANGLLTR